MAETSTVRGRMARFTRLDELAVLAFGLPVGRWRAARDTGCQQQGDDPQPHHGGTIAGRRDGHTGHIGRPKPSEVSAVRWWL